jgi:hypothetical protein
MSKYRQRVDPSSKSPRCQLVYPLYVSAKYVEISDGDMIIHDRKESCDYWEIHHEQRHVDLNTARFEEVADPSCRSRSCTKRSSQNLSDPPALTSKWGGLVSQAILLSPRLLKTAKRLGPRNPSAVGLARTVSPPGDGFMYAICGAKQD